ncbi:MAG: hypothetical protein Q8O42_12335 [Acidobacteriota bacterium]|nr:hypothetical protein [Acidobacteriota bacterium]
MSDAELWASWRMWMVVATVVVLLAAGLLLAILVTARKILNEAVRALNAVEVIRKNTQPTWELQTTNEVAERILATVEAIEAKGGALVSALDGQTARRS